MARRRAVKPKLWVSQWIAAGWLGLVTSTPEGERRSALARHGMRERLVQALRRASVSRLLDESGGRQRGIAPLARLAANNAAAFLTLALASNACSAT